MDAPSRSDVFTHLYETFLKAGRVFAEGLLALDKAMKENPEVLERIRIWADLFKTFPDRQRIVMMAAADQGWYLAAIASLRSNPPHAEAEINPFYTAFMEEHWDELTTDLVAQHPDRRPFLDRAFERHQAGDYISSVPLFLMQADGICEDLLSTHFFTEMDKRDLLLEGLKTAPDRYTASMVDVLMHRNQMTERFSKPSAPPNSRAPNRAGILHGRKEYMDYPTKVNSLKCFSLVCFISMMLGDGGVIPPADRTATPTSSQGAATPSQTG